MQVHMCYITLLEVKGQHSEICTLGSRNLTQVLRLDYEVFFYMLSLPTSHPQTIIRAYIAWLFIFRYYKYQRRYSCNYHRTENRPTLQSDKTRFGQNPVWYGSVSVHFDPSSNALSPESPFTFNSDLTPFRPFFTAGITSENMSSMGQ